MPPHPDSAARTHRPRGPSGAARGSEALFHPENHRVFRTILPRSSLRVDGKRELRYPLLGVGTGVGLVKKLLVYLAHVFFRETGAIRGVLKRLPSKVAARVVELVFNKNERALLIEGD